MMQNPFTFLAEGILDIHMTQGETETLTFLKEQLVLKNEGNPYFEQVPWFALLFTYVQLLRATD